MTEEQRNATIMEKVKEAFVEGYQAGALDHSLGVYDVENAWLQLMLLTRLTAQETRG